MFGKCMNGDCGVDHSGSATGDKNLHMMGAFDRWFEHAGYVNGKFFDSDAANCTWPWDVNIEKCQTKTHQGGEWAGRGDGYDTSTIGNVTVEWLEATVHAQRASGERRPFFVYFAPRERRGGTRTGPVTLMMDVRV